MSPACNGSRDSRPLLCRLVSLRFLLLLVSPRFLGFRIVRVFRKSFTANFFAFAVTCLSLTLLCAAHASAAELRIPLTELAGVIQAVIGDAKLHLHNKPASLLNMTSASHLAIAGKEVPIPLAPKSFSVLGSTYAYYADDLNSDSIRVSAATSAVRLTLNFETKAANIIGGCVSGDCGLTDALPKILWTNGTVAIDVVAIHFGSSISLQVKNVTIGGLISARCEPTGNFFSDSACKAGLSYANRTIAKLKPDIAAKIKDHVNASETQSKVADGLKKYLALGPSGELAITSVTTSEKSVTIAFQLADTVGQ